MYGTNSSRLFRAWRHCGLLLLLLSQASIAWACENETVRIIHGGSPGVLIRYRVQINAFVQNGVIAEGIADQIQCLNNGDVVSVTVTEVNGQAVNFPASGSPRTATGTAGEVLSFTVSGTAPQVNWRLDSKTCNETLFDQVYQVIINGQVVGTSGVIKPGDCFEFHFSDPQKKSIQLVRFMVTPDGERINPEYSRTIGTGDPNWYQDGSTPPGMNTGTDNPVGVPNAHVGQGKIPFAESADPAKEDTLRKVGEALYDATAQSGRNTVSELRGVHGKLSAVENALNAGFLNVNGNLVSVKSAVEAINNSMSGVNTRLDALNNTATQTKGVIDNQYAKIISMDAKFDSANGYLLNLKDGQQSVIAKLGNIDTDLDGVAKETTLSATTSTISSEGQSTRESLGTIHTTMTQTKDAVGAGNQINQDGHVANQASLEQVKSVLSAVYAAIDGARTEANASASAHSGKLDLANQHLSDIKNQTANLGGKLDGLGNKLDLVNGAIVNNGTKIDGVKSAVEQNTLSTSNKLEEIRKKLPKYLEEGSTEYNSHGAAGEGFASTEADNLHGIAGGLTGGTGNFGVPAPSPSIFTISFAGATLDLNPMSNPSFAAIAQWVRSLINWLATFFLVYVCYSATLQALQAAGAFQQVKGVTEQTPVIGTLTTITSGLIARIVIGTALAAIPAFYVAWKASNASFFQTLGLNPFASGDSAVATGIWLLDQFVPLVTIITDLIIALTYKLGLGAVIWAKQMVVRFLPS
jgi:hypothetical protein